MCYYESRCIKNLKKKDLIQVRKSCNVFRFIDDFNLINDARIFESNFEDIYPEESALCRGNSDAAEAIFLEADIKLKNNTLKQAF